MTDRGQAFTLEAFVAAVLLLATVAFALQAAAISSNTASAADAELGNQRRALAAGVLDQSAANGTLQSTLLYWDEDDETFYSAGDDGYYVAEGPPTAFGSAMGAMFDDRGIRYNVDLYYPTATGDRKRQRLVESGTPGDDAVRLVETVTLYDDTNLVYANETERNVTLADVEADANETFYAPDAATGGPTYNVVRVEVVLWET